MHNNRRSMEVNAGDHTMSGIFLQTGALAGPAIVSNVTVPLLGLSDTFITGHLGSAEYIAAIAVGTMMVNAIYWLCGFLRMGTTGLAAEAFGQRDADRRRRILTAAMLLGSVIGLAMIALSPALRSLMIDIMDPPESSGLLAGKYFMISVMGAPAVLVTMALTGWMVGSQNTFYPMVVAISVNVINIILSFTLVFGLEAGFLGVAYGTLAANWCGVLIAFVCGKRMMKGGPLLSGVKGLWKGIEPGRFFKVNGNLFIRSACLMSVSFALTGYAGGYGNETLAVNALLMQFFLFFSYFMDGFAFGGEALCGRFSGAADRRGLVLSVKALAAWSVIVTVAFTIIYVFFTPEIASLLTDVKSVRVSLEEVNWIVWTLPAVSVAAFMFDGVYVGLADTGRMMVATMAGAVLFFVLHYSFPALSRYFGHSGEILPPAGILWICYLSFLLVRGAYLGLSLPSAIRNVGKS